jgi:hypothetical protein
VGTEAIALGRAMGAARLGQLRGMRLDTETIAQVVTALSAGEAVIGNSLAQRRQASERERLARDFGAGAISAAELIERTQDSLVPEAQPRNRTIEPEQAVAWLGNMSRLIDEATPEQLAQGGVEGWRPRQVPWTATPTLVRIPIVGRAGILNHRIYSRRQRA